MSLKLSRLLAAALAVASSSLAYAHPGHADGALAGFAHPLLGWDHLLAMLAVGVWASRQDGRAKWTIPASFMLIMLLAASAGMAGMALPAVESGIATSLLLLGLLLAFSVKLEPAAGTLLVALFAVFHGHAHGMEIPASATPWLHAGGFTLATGLLHGLGMWLGKSLRPDGWLLRAVGTGVAATGCWLLAAV